MTDILTGVRRYFNVVLTWVFLIARNIEYFLKLIGHFFSYENCLLIFLVHLLTGSFIYSFTLQILDISLLS